MKKLENVTTETARAVFTHHFGKEPKKLQQIHGGATNFVFEASIGNEDLILRISNKATKLQYFMKEQWAVRAARARKVPTPEILEVGNDIIAMPYMVMRRVEGEPATARAIDLDIYRQMGAHARAINSITTSDFVPEPPVWVPLASGTMRHTSTLSNWLSSFCQWRSSWM